MSRSLTASAAPNRLKSQLACFAGLGRSLGRNETLGIVNADFVP